MLKEEAWKVWRRYSSLHFLPFCGKRSFSFPLFGFVYFRFFLLNSIAFRFWSGNDFMKIVHLINWFSDHFRFFWSLNWVERLPSNECRNILLLAFSPVLYYDLSIIGSCRLSAEWERVDCRVPGALIESVLRFFFFSIVGFIYVDTMQGTNRVYSIDGRFGWLGTWRRIHRFQ